MWIKAKHVIVDNQGRTVDRNITVNLSNAICYAELDGEKSRIYFEVGHDLEDHRNASWVDVHEPKEKLDDIIGKSKKK